MKRPVIPTHWVALPFSQLHNTLERNTEAKRLEHPQTIGDHIRKKRLSLKLTQEILAPALHVNVRTLTYWELHLSEPHIKQMPRIINWLGYNPCPAPITFGQKLKNYRTEHGLSCQDLRKLLGVDISSIYSWEADKYLPQAKYLVRILEVLQIEV